MLNRAQQNSKKKALLLSLFGAKKLKNTCGCKTVIFLYDVDLKESNHQKFIDFFKGDKKFFVGNL
jgi:Zn/Cd-binding protein ZinT